MKKRNSIIILFSLISGFFIVGFASIGKIFGQLFHKKITPIRENIFLDSLNFLAHLGPKSFWKNPTGLKIGRSFSTFLHYIFAKEEHFIEKNETQVQDSLRPSGGGKGKKGFTLIETIISITLFALILVVAFGALSGVSMGKLSVNNKLDLNKDIYYAIEKFSALVKDGGTIDYEEYWNRLATNSGQTNISGSGHYTKFSGYGNYGTGANSATYLYQCSSTPNPVGTMGSGGCLQAGNQRYGEYRLQFIDYGLASITDDDEDLGMGPIVFTGGENVKELYLINKTGTKKERLLFRLNYAQDPGNMSVTCNGTPTNSGCIGNLQMLQLDGADLGYGHLGSGTGANDGVIDTWNCDPTFCTGMPTETESGWVDIFPSYLNVKDVQFFISPNKDPKYAWKEATTITAPYVRVLMRIGFAMERKKQLKGADPTVTISTTLNLE